MARLWRDQGQQGSNCFVADRIALEPPARMARVPEASIRLTVKRQSARVQRST